MAESIVAGLISKLAPLAAEEVIQAWNLDKDLDTLSKKFELIVGLLHDAHTKKITMSSVKNWFDLLEDVANDTDAFIDELAYEVTRRKVENQPWIAFMENCHKVWDCFIASTNTLMYPFKVARKIKSIHASFDTIRELARDIGLRPVEHLNIIVQPRDIRNKPHYEDKSSIVGRDMDVSNLVQAVCKNNIEQDLNVVAIVGMGGQGKTTLARMVFNDVDVSKMFPKRMWITISDDFKLISILNEMVESLTSTKSDLKNTQGLVNVLQKSVKGEKFLLVLDDVWNEESVKWEDLRNCLLGVGGAKGSSVIVTTRNKEVIDAMHKCVPYPLGNLQEDSSYELFRKIAFQDGEVSEIQPFVDLGRSMVKRCGGLPLAIKVLAGLLQSKKSKQEWREIQNNEIWKSKGVLSSLRLSYDNLPYSSLKRCFAYCSIIPKDSVIYKDELIQIWMALGFLLPMPGTAALMEDIGKEYFNILLCHSLLQDIERDEFGNIESCKMHDLVHDLALDLSKHHSLTLRTGAELNHLSTATYLRIDNSVSDMIPTIPKRNFEKVRLLYAGLNIYDDVLPYIAHLSVLVLNKFSYQHAGKLQKSIRNLKYIKHLDISCLRFGKVPSYITELYNLQTLRVYTLQKLPKKFCNLINLRHFYIEHTYGTKSFLHGIERLTCLQTLPYIVVSKSQNCLIGQLEGLQNLGGKLKLYGLGDVANMEEASKAKLYLKPNIQSLLLNWSTNEDERVNNSDEDEHVMEGLEPHSNLKELIIENFRGKRLASWITKMTNLVKIKLSNCERCEELPSLGHLPQLREMYIDNLSNVRMIGSNFGDAATYPALIKLILYELPKLEEWVEADKSGDQKVFPKLEVLEIRGCSGLRIMPDICFESLKKLIVFDTDVILEQMSMTVLRRPGKSISIFYDHRKELIIENFMGKRLASWITKMTNLVEIKLFNCERCEELPSLGHLPQLRVMEIRYLSKVRMIGSNFGDAATYPALKKLILYELPMLEEWVEADKSGDQRVFPKLEVLEIRGCSKLRILPDSCFESLKKLTVFDSDDILKQMSMKVSSLSYGYICGGEVHVIEKLLKNNSQTLTDLEVRGCLGLTRLTVGVALEYLNVRGCPALTRIDVVEEICCLRYLTIWDCPSLSEIDQSVSSTVESLILFGGKIPLAFSSSSSVISFPNLTHLDLDGTKKSKFEFDDHLISAFSTVTHLRIDNFEQMKALPDTIAKLPSLEELSILYCLKLESLPTFDQSHTIQRLHIQKCDILEERCKKDTGVEWFKIQYIPIVKFNSLCYTGRM